MTSTSEFPFKPPPTIECISREHCLGFGKKAYAPDKICQDCIKRHDPQQLRIWANDNAPAISLIDEEIARKQDTKRNIESHGRYLCAFEDPDFQHCRWRLYDLNLRGSRVTCSVVQRKGAACGKCWGRHLQRIGIVQYFTPLGLCHEEAYKEEVVSSHEQSVAAREEEDDDIEGYDTILF